LNLSPIQESKLRNGKTIQITKENYGSGNIVTYVDDKTLKKIKKAMSNDKGVRLDGLTLRDSEGGSLFKSLKRGLSNLGNNVSSVSKSLSAEQKEMVKNKIMESIQNRNTGSGIHHVQSEYDSDDEVNGTGRSYWGRVNRRFKNTMRQVKNTGNQIQAGLDQVVPREVQREIKGHAIDVGKQAAVAYLTSGQGLSHAGSIKYTPTYQELPHMDIYKALPTSKLQINSKNSLYKNKPVVGSSFRGSSYRGPM
jgi:hypothetical protein